MNKELSKELFEEYSKRNGKICPFINKPCILEKCLSYHQGTKEEGYIWDRCYQYDQTIGPIGCRQIKERLQT